MKCDREIEACKWMPLEEFVSSPDVLSTNKHFGKMFLKNREIGVAIKRQEMELSVKNFVRKQQIYGLDLQ